MLHPISCSVFLYWITKANSGKKKKKAFPVLCYLMHLTISMKLFSIVLLFCSVSTNPCQAHCMAFTSILLNDNVEVPNDENYRVGFIL